MTGSSAGIRPSKSFPDLTVDLMVNQEQNFIGAMKVTGTESSFGGIVGLGTVGGSGSGKPVGNFLETGGGTMLGPIAYFPVNVTIDSDNNINIGFEQGAYSTYVKITGATPTDDLENIIGAQHAGQDLILQGTVGDTITLKTTGNITPPDGADFDLIGDAMLRLIFDPDTNKWVSNFTGGTGAITNQIIDGDTFAIVVDSIPSFSVSLNAVQKFSIADTRIDLEDLDIFGIETLWFNDSVGSPTFVSMGQTGAQIFTINVIDSNDAIDIKHAGDLSARFQDGRFQLFSADPNIQ